MKTKLTTLEKLKIGMASAKAVMDGREKPVAVHYLHPDAKEIRELLGVSQTNMASMIGVSVHTLRNWEQGHREPEGAAKVLLSMAAKEPETVKRLVGDVYKDAGKIKSSNTRKKVAKRSTAKRKLVSA